MAVLVALIDAGAGATTGAATVAGVVVLGRVGADEGLLLGSSSYIPIHRQNTESHVSLGLNGRHEYESVTELRRTCVLP
jgi:hypothetical protein